MENDIKNIIVLLFTGYILYLFLLCFLVTTFVYLTYRFWKMILNKEEHNICISKSSIIGYNNNNSSSKNKIVDKDGGKLLSFIERYIYLLTIGLAVFIIFIAKLIGLF